MTRVRTWGQRSHPGYAHRALTASSPTRHHSCWVTFWRKQRLERAGQRQVQQHLCPRSWLGLLRSEYTNEDAAAHSCRDSLDKYRLIYLSDHIEAVWVDASDRVGVLPPRLVQQVEQTRALIEAGIFTPVKGLLNGYADRCAGCMVAHVCDV